MAFLKSKREPLHCQTNTPSHIGPGSYFQLEQDDSSFFHPVIHKSLDMPLPQSMKFSRAPFSSTTKRKLTDVEDEFITPGPGSYIKPLNVSQKKKVSSTVFVSKTDRFNNSFEKLSKSLPGPGSYNVDAPKSPDQTRKTKRDNNPQGKNVVWVRVSTVPSIPCGAQTHGYEEGPNGELVRQKPPYKGFSGTPQDSVGPGEYDWYPANSSVKERILFKGTAGFKSTSKREAFEGLINKDNPGPGSYQVAASSVEEDTEYDVPKNTSMFASTTGRSQWYYSPEKSNPGPGQYGYHSSFNKEVLPERLQSFGSTTARPFDVPSDVANPINKIGPGPGHYDVERKQRSISPPCLHGPFNSTTDRFMENETEPQILGPGTYDSSSHYEVATEVHRKARQSGYFGVFGTTSKRFGKPKSKSPGPGSYFPERAERLVYVRKNDQRSSVFASRTKRNTIGNKRKT